MRIYKVWDDESRPYYHHTRKAAEALARGNSSDGKISIVSAIDLETSGRENICHILNGEWFCDDSNVSKWVDGRQVSTVAD